VAGYGPEVESYPEAAAASFGCGNPLAHAEIERGQTVVDLGSGAGLDLLIAADRVGVRGRVIGVDMTDVMVRAARRAAREAAFPNVEVRRGLIEEIPVEDGIADWVISNCVINLSPDKESVFAEIHRVLKPGGRLSVSDIVCGDLPGSLRTSGAAYAACIAGAISEAEYVAGLERAGLVEVTVVERTAYSHEQLRTMLRHDPASYGLEAGPLETALRDAVGRVASIRVTAQKPW